jgi:hypothetical protein
MVRPAAKAGAALMADPVAAERLEVLERREVEQHHDEPRLGARQLAGALSRRARGGQPVRPPVPERPAKVVETATQRRDVDGH